MPFYLYGTPTSLSIDHILVRSPNISLSATDITLSPSTFPSSLPSSALEKGAILTINDIPEAAMQPFQSTAGPLGDTLGSGEGSTFFFRPGQEFDVTVYKDPKAWDEPGPGLVDLSKATVLGEGKMKLGEGRYVDSVEINRDPFEVKDGDEKFRAWKKVFDSIGKELE